MLQESEVKANIYLIRDSSLRQQLIELHDIRCPPEALAWLQIRSWAL